MLESRLVVLVVISALVAGPALGETVQGKGALRVPVPQEEGTSSVEVVPISKLEGDAITVTWRMEVQHVTSSDGRESALILFLHYRVPDGVEMSSRLDFAFFDEAGRLLHTFETSEYSVRSTETDDPGRFPTWRVFAASDRHGLRVEELDAVRSYQVVIRAN
jgi:hypothetical protein